MIMQAKIREAGVGFVNSGFGQNARAQGLQVLFPVKEYAPDAVCCRQTALRSSVEANRDAMGLYPHQLSGGMA